MDADFPLTVRQLFDTQCIVEVLCVFRVYGASPCVPEVLTLGKVFLCDNAGYLIGSILDTLRILVRQSVLGENGVHLDIIVTRRTKNIDYFANQILMIGVRPLSYLYHSTVVGLATLQLLLRDKDVVDE